jgi:glycosyltransferase involved in cell wall biosynthesis
MNLKSATGPDETIEISDAGQLAAEPTVSVLMMVYNHRDFLAQAIESVLSQKTRFPIELLIGEDRSTDGARELAMDFQRRYPASIRVLTAERNVGAHRNYMRLLGAARGEFIAHIDGDDYWLPDKLARQVALLRQCPEATAAYCNALVSDGDGVMVGRFNDVGDERLDLAGLFRRGNFLCMSTMLFRASQSSALRGIGREFIDYQVHLTHAQKGTLLHVGEPLAVYRVQSPGSMVANDNARVRALYWQAIQSVPRDRTSDDDRAHALADFMRRVFFRAVRMRRWHLISEWTAQVLQASPFGALRTCLLVAGSIVRIAYKQAAGLFSRGPDGRRMHVLYRR